VLQAKLIYLSPQVIGPIFSLYKIYLLQPLITQCVINLNVKTNEQTLPQERKGTSGVGGQERVMGVNMIKVIIYIYENVIMKPIILYNIYQ
jgi:hypothetical protein